MYKVYTLSTMVNGADKVIRLLVDDKQIKSNDAKLSPTPTAIDHSGFIYYKHISEILQTDCWFEESM